MIALGCFISLKVSNNSNEEESKEEDDSYEEEIILGALISQVKIGKDDIIEIHNHHQQLERMKESYLTYFMNAVSCRSFNMYYGQFDDIEGCYIMSLGVIDECRKFGIGTLLIE